MALPTTKSFGSFLVQVGNGGAPEVFAAPCGFTEKAFTLSADTSDTNIPDCDNPDLPTWKGRDIVSQSAEVSGQGVMAAEAMPTWRAWFLSGAGRNLRILISGSGASGGGYWAGSFKLTALELGATLGEKVKCNVTAVSDGAVTWTASA